MPQITDIYRPPRSGRARFDSLSRVVTVVVPGARAYYYAVKAVRRATWLLGAAAICLAWVFVSVGGILRINTALSGLFNGAGGVFFLGMTTTRANQQGQPVLLLCAAAAAALSTWAIHSSAAVAR